MLLPDAAFRAAANAAAQAYDTAPPYLEYHTVAIVDIPALKQYRVIEREVETRTADDYAVLQDLPRGQRQYGHSFPLIPTFDALSYFHIDFSAPRRNLTSSITLDQPIRFSNPKPSDPNVAVVVTMLKYYYPQDAADSTGAIRHLVMQPLPALTHGNPSTFYIHDVYIDTATNLPTRVVYEGPQITFALDYVVVQNHWLVSHAHYDRSFVAPLHIGSTHFTADATFDRFAFPALPSDPHLAGPPSSRPSP